MANFADAYRVKPDSRVDLSKYDPADTGDYKTKGRARKDLAKNIKRLYELQEVLYAENRRAVLMVLQAPDAGGKDGTIRHVMSGLNPQGCRVTSFKQPSQEELAHDFLWRIHRAVPRMGEIGIFNRSHYEDVLIVRVHGLVDKAVWSKRYEQINAFERYLTDCGVHVIKFYLHISKTEQLKRFKARIDDPTKFWKIDPADFKERKYWDEYMRAYEDVLNRCSTAAAPWYVVPADHKWFRNLVVSQILVETMESFGMDYPKPRFSRDELRIE